MAWSIKSAIIFVSLPVVAVCAATLYYYHLKDKEWEEYMRYINRKEIEVKVPISCVGNLIGRAGINIKELQDTTKTKINFKNVEGDETHKICRIVGSNENVELAKTMILEFISPIDVKTLEMWVPQSACGQIIGRCGDNIKFIAKTSNAKVTVERNSMSMGKKLVIITGKEQEIEVAKALIEEKVKANEMARKQVHNHNNLGSPRTRVKNRKNENIEKKILNYERLIATTSDNMIQVYVCAVASPANFWVQLISPRGVDLDHLVDNMTDYYNKEENRELHKLKEVKAGQIVVSQYENDKKWYRVEVLSVEANESNPDEGQVDSFFLDYGDSAFEKLGDVYDIHPDFLNLKFQAIECSYAGIKPKDGGETWNEEAIDIFEDMLQAAQWKLKLAQIIEYRESSSSRRGPIPCIKLYNPGASPGVDIGKEFIEKGYAIAVKTEEPLPRDDDSLISDEALSNNDWE